MELVVLAAPTEQELVEVLNLLVHLVWQEPMVQTLAKQAILASLLQQATFHLPGLLLMVHVQLEDILTLVPLLALIVLVALIPLQHHLIAALVQRVIIATLVARLKHTSLVLMVIIQLLQIVRTHVLLATMIVIVMVFVR